MTITEGELAFFRNIKNQCRTIFDVGVQEDIHYIEMQPEGIFHLFEPNITFAGNVWEKTKRLKTEIYLNTFGLGKESKRIKYYPDSQSFIKRTVDFQSDEKLALYLEIVDFKEYLSDHKIESIDFIKMDMEGGEPDILFYNIKFLKTNVKFIQFEYASTWLDREEKFSIYDVFEKFSDTFDFYALYNKEHPMFSDKTGKTKIFSFEKENLELIDGYMRSSYGFEIAMVRKDVMK